MVLSAIGCFVLYLYLISNGHVALGGGIPYVNQLKGHQNMFSSKNASFPPPAQLKFGKYLVLFVNGTLRMGTETLEFVGENDVQIHGKKFRIAGNKLVIGNDTVIPKDGNKIMLKTGVVMHPDGTLTRDGPEQKSDAGLAETCGIEGTLCGDAINGNCCEGYRCWQDVCRICNSRKEYRLLPCYSDLDCGECYPGYGFCRPGEKEKWTKFCCLPVGYTCKEDKDCCENTFCETIPNQYSRCRAKPELCKDLAHCKDNTECCSTHECKYAQCQCKVGQYCNGNMEFRIGESCDNGNCVCREGAGCQEKSDCCYDQNCVNNQCKLCKLMSEPCKVNSDCCSNGHCHRGYCRHNFLMGNWVKYADTNELWKIPIQCLLEDVNAGYGGKYVYVCPLYTYKADEAITGFEIFIGKCDRNDDWDDLAKGDGSGVCRYLNPQLDKTNPSRVYRIEWSGTKPNPDETYYATAGDINKGRNKNLGPFVPPVRQMFFNWHLYPLDPNVDFKSSVRENEPCDNDDDCGDEGHCHKKFCRKNFVKDIRVFYQDVYNPYKIPPYCLPFNINHKLGGYFVFVCPIWTSRAAEAAVSIEFEIDKDCKRASNLDLTKGSGDGCRYLVPVVDKNQELKINQIEFTSLFIHVTPLYETVGNINRQGRTRGAALFFNWRKVSIPLDDQDPPYKDEECGPRHGDSICSGSLNALCCSRHGFCGNTEDFCGDGCQPLYGNCKYAKPEDVNFRCGPAMNKLCTGAHKEECCSIHGFCGSSVEYCGEGCQRGWGGRCN